MNPIRLSALRIAVLALIMSFSSMLGCGVLVGIDDVKLGELDSGTSTVEDGATGGKDGGPIEDGDVTDVPGTDGTLTDTSTTDSTVTDASSDVDSAVPVPQLAIDQTTQDFGTMVVGSTVTPSPFKITNVGTGSTGQLTTAISGEASSAFTISSDTCANATLAPNAFCTLNVSPVVSNAGTFSGTLVVSEGASDQVHADLTSVILTPGALQITPADNNFGTQVVSTQGSDVTFTVKNTGASPTTAISVSITGSDAVDFGKGTDGCNNTALNANASCQIKVHFKPLSLGLNKGASLVVTASTGGTDTATLHGDGVAAASLTFNPNPVTFVASDLNVAKQTTVTVTNAGGVATSALGVTVSGTNALDFTTSGCAGSVLQPNGQCTLTVTITPKARGPRSASIDFTGVTPTAHLPVSGDGQDSVLLTAIKGGNGGGTITGTGINCPGDCTETIPRPDVTDPVIQLTATHDGSSTFTGWTGGGCTGSTSLTCDVTMSGAQNVTATFAKITYTITFDMKWFGPVTGASVNSTPSSNISCSGGPCSNVIATFDIDQVVSINPTVNPPPTGFLYHFSGPDCQGGTCQLTMTKNMVVSLIVSAYNYVFTTNNSYSTILGALSNYDTKCQQAASAAKLPGTYKAFMSTVGGGDAGPAVDANTRFGSARGWIRPDGKPVMDTMLKTGNQAGSPVYYPIGITEKGTVKPNNNPAILGSAPDGTVDKDLSNNYTCNDWTTSTPQNVHLAYPDSMGADWTRSGGTTCGTGSFWALHCYGTDMSHALSIPAPGGPVRRVFISKAQWDASGGVSPSSTPGTADNLCKTEATNAGLANAANFIAFIATNGKTAASRVNANGAPWFRTDNLPVAASNSAFVAGTLDIPLVVTADKTYAVEYEAYTRFGAANPNTAGTLATTCQDWSSNSGSDTASTAIAHSLQWVLTPPNSYACANAMHVYCIEP
jgi:hypothetical protein